MDALFLIMRGAVFCVVGEVLAWSLQLWVCWMCSFCAKRLLDAVKNLNSSCLSELTVID